MNFPEQLTSEEIAQKVFSGVYDVSMRLQDCDFTTDEFNSEQDLFEFLCDDVSHGKIVFNDDVCYKKHSTKANWFTN